MNVCLPKETTEKFLEALKDGTIDLAKLSVMDTDSARAEFEKVLGKQDALWVNTRFEQGLAWKNQEAGVIDFIQTVGGLKPEVRNDYIARVKKLGTVMTPKNLDRFLNDLADRRLGLSVTPKQAETVVRLAQKIDALDPAKKDTVNNVKKLLDESEKVSGLTPEQKSDISSLKTILQKDIDAKEAMLKDRQSKRESLRAEKASERQKVREANKARLDKQRGEQKAERDAFREYAKEQRMQEALQEKYDRDLERKQFREQQRIDRLNQKAEDDARRAEQKEIDDFDRETARLAKKADQQLTKDALGSLSGKIRKMFPDGAPEALQNKINGLKQELENPTVESFSGVSDDYFKAKNDLADYIASQKPIEAGRSILSNLSTIGRNNLLASPATPSKTLLGQAEARLVTAVTNRVAYMSLNGKVDPETLAEHDRQIAKTMTKTGYNPLSMEDIDDKHVLNKSERFSVPEGKVSGNEAVSKLDSALRAIAKFSNRVIIDWAHNIPFQHSYRKTWISTANFAATDFAKKEGLSGRELSERATQIYLDAAKIRPETEVGTAVRRQAQAAAEFVTSTNRTIASFISGGMKNLLNQAGDKFLNGFQVGNFIEPIAVISANLIWNGVEAAGVGVFTGGSNIIEGYKKTQSDDPKTQYEGMNQMKNGYKSLALVFGTAVIAAIWASQLQKDDFRTDTFGKSYIKMGKWWVNTEYLPLIGPALSGDMTIRQAGGGIGKDSLDYVKGVANSLLGIPGINELDSIVTSLVNGTEQKDVTSFLTSRFVPVLASDLTKTRPVNRILFGANGLESQTQYGQDTMATKITSDAKTASTNLGKLDPNDTDIARTTWAEVQKDGLGSDAANQLTSGLTKNQYTAYKLVKDSDVAYQTSLEKKVTPIVNQAFKDGFGTDKANALVAGLSPDEFKMYSAVKKALYPDTTVRAGTADPSKTAASFEGYATFGGDHQVSTILSGKNADDGTIKGHNPNGEPIYARDVKLEASERKILYNQDPYWAQHGIQLDELQYDHIVPLEAGGTNTVNNVQLITKAADDENNLFENTLGSLYKLGQITRQQSAHASIDYKINRNISIEDLTNYGVSKENLDVALVKASKENGGEN